MIKHKHHIIPRHAGGTDDPINLVELTVEEHAEAHRKLYEEYGRKEDLCAWKGLSGQWSRLQVHNYMRTGSLHTEETKRKISESKKGVKLTKEHKIKIAESRRGCPQPESQKEKVAVANSYDWIVITPDGEQLEVTNLSRFAKEHGLDQGNLVKVAQGKMRQSKGYVVSYAE